jgi:hypothetical protein
MSPRSNHTRLPSAPALPELGARTGAIVQHATATTITTTTTTRSGWVSVRA